MQHDTVCPLPNHRLTFTNTWHLNKRTIPWPQNNFKDTNRTRSVSRWLCAAMLMAWTSFRFLSLANMKTLVASKTSTETTLDASTEATQRPGWHKSSFSSGWKGLMHGWQGIMFFFIMDNCSAHIPLMQLVSVVTLYNTTVFYLPPNTTLKIQPCDAGIIRSLKAYYRRRFNCLFI